jgi:hypothetical protein
MIQHKESGMKVHIWIGKSRIAGKGLFAGQDILKETIITRYSGSKIAKARVCPTFYTHGSSAI